MPDRSLPGLGLSGYWDLGSDTWKPGMDTNLRLLSAVAGARVTSRTAALPESPGALSIQIAPLGDAQENKLAIWDGESGAEAWVYLTAQPGWHFYVIDEGINIQWTGLAWVEFAGAGGGTSGGGATSGPQIVLTAEQSVGQLIDTTTETVDFDTVTEDSNSLWNAVDATIRMPADAAGRTVVIVAQTKHSADGAGALETVLERSEDSGSTWDVIGSSGTSEDYFGISRLTALVVLLGNEWYRVRQTTVATKTTSGDNQTALSLTTIGDGQVGRIIKRTQTVPLLNPQFNAGDFTSWTNSTGSGTLKIYIPPDKEYDHVLHPSGFNYMGLAGSTGGPWFIEQKITIPSESGTLTVQWDQHTRLVDDQMRLEIDWLDLGDSVLSTYLGPSYVNSANQLWERFGDTVGSIPAGAVAAMVRFRTVVTGGSQQINITNFSCQVGILGVSGMLPGSVYAYLPELATNQDKVLTVNATGDGVEWGFVPLRIQAGGIDQAKPQGIEFLGTDFSATLDGDTVQIEFQGKVAVDGAGGEVTAGLTRLTFTGAGVGLSSPIAGEIDITIPGPGEAVPPATAIEEIDGFEVVRSNLGGFDRGRPLVWDGPANAFVPLPPDLGTIAYGGGSQVLVDQDMTGLSDFTLTEADHNLSNFDELHFFLFQTDIRADIFISSDGGSTVETVNRAYSGDGGTSEGTEGDDEFYLGGWDAVEAGQLGYGVMTFASNPDSYTFWNMFGATSGVRSERKEFSHTIARSTINHILVDGSSGNFTAGRLMVIGVKKGTQPVDLSARVENGAAFTSDQELLFQETMGVRFLPGVRGRVRVDPAANADAEFQLTSGDGTVIGTATVLASETEADFVLVSSATVSDAVKVLAPTIVDSAIQSAYIALRGEANR